MAGFENMLGYSADQDHATNNEYRDTDPYPLYYLLGSFFVQKTHS